MLILCLWFLRALYVFSSAYMSASVPVYTFSSACLVYLCVCVYCWFSVYCWIIFNLMSCHMLLCFHSLFAHACMLPIIFVSFLCRPSSAILGVINPCLCACVGLFMLMHPSSLRGSIHCLCRSPILCCLIDGSTLRRKSLLPLLCVHPRLCLFAIPDSLPSYVVFCS
mgnify:CR=1 FL=1